MKIKVNGEEYETACETLGGLLEEMKVVRERVAVEVNLTIVKRADVPGFSIKEGDVIEIVNFVGGGRPERNGRSSNLIKFVEQNEAIY